MAKCIRCGCTDRRACAGGCSWVRKNGAVGVCSACVQSAPITLTIVFEDHGQDFRRWYLDKLGIVVDCRPFQASIWAGLIVMNPDVQPGGLVTYCEPGKAPSASTTIRYRVERVEVGEFHPAGKRSRAGRS